MVTRWPARTMAAASLTLWGTLCVAADAEQKAEPLLVRLDPQRRAKVVMALLALLLVGAGLMALVILGGRQVLRAARKSHGPTRHDEDAWYRKPLVPHEPDARDRE